MAGDVPKGFLFPFNKVDHRAGDSLLAFECGHTWTFAKRHSALVDIGHLGRLDGFVAAIVVEHQKTLVCNNFVFVEQLFGAGKIPLGIDMFDVDFSFTGILIFGQQILNVRSNRCVWCKENRHAHLAVERVEKALRFI